MHVPNSSEKMNVMDNEGLYNDEEFIEWVEENDKMQVWILSISHVVSWVRCGS